MKSISQFVLSLVVLLGSCASADTTLTVAIDGSAQYKTVQAAIDAAPAGRAEPVVIHIKPGVYKQQLRVAKDKSHIVLQGEDAKTTVLTNDLSSHSPGKNGKEVGTTGSSSTFIDGPDFTAQNITFQNSAGDVGQAVAIKFN